MLGTPLGRILLDRPAWTYLLGPFFKAASTPDAAAPLSATYREAGAVGALTVTDTTNKLSTAGGALLFAPATVAGWGDPQLYGAAVTRAGGRALFGTLTVTAGTGVAVGFDANASQYAESAGFYYNISTGNLSAYVNNSNGPAVSVGSLATAYRFAVVLRATGMFLALLGGTYTNWTLVWVGNAGTTTPLYAGLASHSASGTLANLRVADLGGAWASDYGIATDRKATSAATDTITHTANCLVEHTITAATGVTQELWVRRTDASNGWIVRMSQAGSTIKLIEVVAGVETERASTAQTWTNGVAYRVVVICHGTTITPYVANVAKTGYASASTNQSATTAYVSDAGSDLVAWPRTVALPTGV